MRVGLKGNFRLRFRVGYVVITRTEKFIPASILNLLKAKPAVVYGRGEERRDWIYVDDNCSGILAAMLTGKSGHIYHFGGGSYPLRNIDIIRSLFKRTCSGDNYLAYINFIKDPRPGHDFKYHLDIVGKTSAALEWLPKVTVWQGLDMTVEWYKKNAQ